jgi:uncharacterized protein (UPF0333 family)
MNKRDENKKISQCNFFAKNRRGQMNLSFGMIFSIILIIVFLAFGFYAIKKFIEMQETIQIQQFMKDVQDDIDKIWRSNGENTQEVDYVLPKKITFACFQNDEFENLKFVSKQIIHGKMIEHLDIVGTINNARELCIENIKGKVAFKLAKDDGEVLVRIEK